MSSIETLPFAAWPTARKIVAGVFVVIGSVALACAAAYMAGVLFLVLNKADPRQAHLTSITHYWSVYADDVRLRKKLQIATGVSGLCLLVLAPAGLFFAARRQRPLHGDARFASAAEVARSGLTRGDKPGILIALDGDRFLSLGGQLSVMLSAPTRSGKGVSVVIPNLLHWSDSVVVLDLKGENYRVTSGFRAQTDNAVFAFSPFDPNARSHRWNPLSAVRTSRLHRVGDLLSIGQVLFPNDGGGTSSEAFFNDQARNLFLGLGLLLLETPALPRTIGEMLRQSSGRGLPLKDHLARLIAQRRGSKKPLSSECVDALQRLMSNSENTLSSVVATFNAPLTIFTDPKVDAATSADDFNLADVRRRRMSIYFRVPADQTANARPLLRLFFSQLVSLNTRVLPEDDKSLKLQCLLINDEFTTMGRVDAITHGAAFLAGYNLRLLTVVQAMSQLDALYGEKEARTFATNHGLQILFAPREQRDADEYSAMLGHFTQRVTTRGRSRSFSARASSSASSNESDQRRALLLPQEFKELGSERLVVIFENCRPILAEKLRYHHHDKFLHRLLPAPVVPRMDMKGHRAWVEQRWRAVEKELAAGQEFNIDQLAGDIHGLPPLAELPPEKAADFLIDMVSDAPPDQPTAGGSIEAAPDADGVLSAEPDVQPATSTRTWRTAMRRGLPLVTCVLFLPWLLALCACATPPGSPSVDESRRRPANVRADVELQICSNDLYNTRLLQAQAQRRAQTAVVALDRVAAHQRMLAGVQATIAPQDSANRVFTVHFGFGDASVAVPDDIATTLVESAKSAPLIVLRGRTDGSGDAPAESRIAQARATAVRDYLVAAGVDPARIRATYQPSGDHLADNASDAGRRLNRRVEIEVYGVLPVPFDPAAFARR